jgi:hypothetical protein
MMLDVEKRVVKEYGISSQANVLETKSIGAEVR